MSVVLTGASLVVQAFNGDGYTDIIWQNNVSNEWAFWFLRQTTLVSSALFPVDLDGDWRIVSVDDFDRDGHSDLLWRSPSTGDNEIWLMNRTQRVTRQPLVNSLSGFEIAGSGDFDGDGHADIVWRDPVINQTAIWFMNGANWNSRLGWINDRIDFRLNLAAIADFNHDGYADILWRQRYTGQNFIWFMRAGRLQQKAEIRPEPDLQLQISGTGSFNLLGNTDLIWSNTNGQHKVWLMSGTQYLATAVLPADASLSWRIAGASGFTSGVLLSAAPDGPSQSLTLRWHHGSSQRPTIERKEPGSASWTVMATNYFPLRYTNSELALGQRYEYHVGGEYLLGAVAASPIEDRGNIILVVEDLLAGEIEDDLALLISDLIGDGWSVIRTNVPRHDDAVWSRNLEPIASIKSFITNIYHQDPLRTKGVYLVGHVPIPYSGFHNPDGHGGRALPADLYFGDVDGIYTDSKVQYGSFLGPDYLPRHGNLIGDGKFDQNRLPPNAEGIEALELAVGRVDFAEMHVFGDITASELTQRYIRKAHDYRHKNWTLPDRVVAGTFFPSGPNRDAYFQALKIGSRLFGNQPGCVVEGDAFDRNHAALFGIVGAFGLPFAIYGTNNRYHLAAEMTQTYREPSIAFAGVFASFCLDFHYPDNFLRAFLGTPTYGLAAMWFRPLPADRIPLAFEPLGLGETIGAGFVRSINESQRMTTANTYVALLGDPTLRFQILAPPRAPAEPPTANSSIAWAPSLDSPASYFVYRSTNRLAGPWIRLTPSPITETAFTDTSAPPEANLYQVRTVKLATTGSGSFTNLSQGIFFESQQTAF